MEINALFNNLFEEMDLELERILEYWSLHSVDQKNGGFVGRIDQLGKVIPEAPKGSVLNSRILWTFSAAYATIGSEKLEKLAKRANDYLMRNFWDHENGGIFWALDAQARPLNTRKQAYAQGFALYGFSEYYKATRNEQSLQYAIQLYYLIEKHFREPVHGGYLEALGKNWEPLADVRLSEKDANSPKSMNTHLHILEPYTNLYRVWPNQQLKESIQSLIHVFLDHIIDKNTGHFQLFFDLDWSVHHSITSYGHSIEGAWLLREAALEVGDSALLAKVEKAALALVDAVVKDGMDTDGSVFNELKSGHLDTDKDWWPQAEAMVGLMDAWQISNNSTYLEAMKKVWEFIRENVIDYENGEWFARVNREGIPYESEDKVGFWKCPYHNTRAILEIIKRMKETAES